MRKNARRMKNNVASWNGDEVKPLETSQDEVKKFEAVVLSSERRKHDKRNS